MKIFSILRPALFLNSHPQEDYFVISKKHPIFVVADGVSLNFDKDSDYPKHSGAGDIAKIFCETVISEAEKRYERFEEKDMREIFDIGSKVVLEYNISHGRTKDTINYWDFDLFSATTSFLLIKNNKAYWWSLCDSGATLFNSKGEQLFFSPNGWTVCQKFLPANWNNIIEKEKIKMLHKDYRNAINKKGELVGYGVVTGEESAKFYLNTGVLNLNAGDLIFLYTDGFENYFDLKEFINIFKLWPENIEYQLEKIISEKAKADPAKYGSEKTLIAIVN